MSETKASLRRTRIYQGSVIASCALAGGIAGGFGLNSHHQNMADRVEYCIGMEPGVDKVTHLTQFCLDESSGNDSTLQGSPVFQEFAVGTPFTELQTVSRQYRQNNVDPGIIVGMFIGTAIGTTAVVFSAPGRRRNKSEEHGVSSEDTSPYHEPAYGETTEFPSAATVDNTDQHTEIRSHQASPGGATAWPPINKAG